MRSPVLVLAGAALGVTLVWACGDDAPPVDAAADAAPVCDCPAAEPPLAGRIVVTTEGGTVTLSANGTATAATGCPSVDATLIGGSCYVNSGDLGALGNVTLVRSGINDPTAVGPSWECAWHSTNSTDLTVTVRAICLLPATP